MEKNFYQKHQSREIHPESKKIQDYIYKFSDQIGMGNFSKVFKGYHQQTNKPVAIKIIQLNSLNNSRLQQLLNTETKILKTLSHPNVIGCQEILLSARNCYIITQLCNGGDLDKKFKKNGHLTEMELYPIASDIYQGLKYLAKKHIIHRDIKTSNIFINNGIYKIADFGFAQLVETQFRDISVGSPIYMSPEGYIDNIYGPKTDVWAFGVMLYELVQGRPPCHNCQSESELKQHLLKQIDYSTFSSEISNDLKNLIIQCLNVNHLQRINMLDIQHMEWMKNVYKITNLIKQQQSPRQNKLEKYPTTSTTQKNYKTIYYDDIKINDISQQQIRITKPTKDNNPNYKANIKKLNNYLLISNEQLPRKYSTLDKPTHKPPLNDNSFQIKANGQSTKIFYSPRNTYSKYERNYHIKNGSPSNKFDSFYLKNNIKYQDYPNNKIKDGKNMTMGSYQFRLNRQQRQNSTGKQKYYLAQNSPRVRQNQQINYHYDKKLTSTTNHHENKQQNKINKKNYKDTHTTHFKNLANTHHTTNNNIVQTQNLQSLTPKANDNRTKISQFFQAKPLKPIIMNKSAQKFENNKETKPTPPPPNHHHPDKIINRPMKFSDCINLIHYCRLCYKLGCLFQQYKQSQQQKHFLFKWSIQLLTELNNKLQKNEIFLKNELEHRMGQKGENEKKKKLKNVIKQYLTKYQQNTQFIDTVFIPLKQASSLIYNIYMSKGRQFKQKLNKNKPQIYFVLLCYISILDRQTRNLMQFVFQIKNSLDGKQVQKLLALKIHEFNHKNLQDIIHQNNQNMVIGFD